MKIFKRPTMKLDERRMYSENNMLLRDTELPIKKIKILMR